MHTLHDHNVYVYLVQCVHNPPPSVRPPIPLKDNANANAHPPVKKVYKVCEIRLQEMGDDKGRA